MGEGSNLWDGNYTSAQNNLFAKVALMEEARSLPSAPAAARRPGLLGTGF